MSAEDEDLDRALREARPATPADEGWAVSSDGAEALAAISAAAEADHAARGLRIRLPRPAGARRPVLRPVTVGVGVAAAAALAIGLAVTLPYHPAHPVAGPRPAPTSASTSPVAPLTGPRPGDIALTGYDTCSTALAGLRRHAAARVTANGLPANDPTLLYGSAVDDLGLTPVPQLDATGAEKSADQGSTPAHSGTNDQEAGVDEPDTIKNDGRRIVTVSGGVLRVTDVASRSVTGTLDLSAYAGAENAQLLMTGNRVLVLLDSGADYVRGNFYGAARPPLSGTTVLLIDTSGSTPKIVSQLRPSGSMLGARLVDGTVRLVLRSTPDLPLTDAPRHSKPAVRRAHYRAQIERAPLSDWLPSYTVTDGGTTTTHAVGCADLSHPTAYSALSILSVYSIDPDAGLGDVAPVSLAADGGAVYASAGSLYLASDTHPYSAKDTTQLHRFDIRAPGRPTYLGSGTVPGSVADSYSMSEYDGSLRVVTSSGGGRGVDGFNNANERHDLYVLNAATLERRGHIGGLGRDENLDAVRFLGPIAYVVTFRQIDPLYVLDLRNPDHPTVAGRLTQPGYSAYLHDVGNGRLLGIGETVDRNTEPNGLLISLFDVATPTHPKRVDRLTRSGTFGGDIEPHAFLYWPADHLAILPVQTPAASGYDTAGTVLVVRVGRNSLRALGTIHNPAVRSSDVYGSGDGIERTLLIGHSIWTFSQSGLAVSDVSTLHREKWLPFR